MCSWDQGTRTHESNNYNGERWPGCVYRMLTQEGEGNVEDGR